MTNNPGEDLVLGPQFIRLCFDEKCSKKQALDFISNVNQDTARPTPFRESDDLFSITASNSLTTIGKALSNHC